MRIAFALESPGAGGVYRATAPMAALARRGHDVQQAAIDGRAGIEQVRRTDVLFVYRECGPAVLRLAQAAKESGAAVVWDNDDDMGAVPRDNPTYRRFGGLQWERRLQAMKRLFRFVDLATAPCAHLAQRLDSAGAVAVEVIENQIPDELAFPHAPSSPGVTIGYVAGLEHRADVDAIPIQDALQRLLDQHSEVHVTSIGLGLGLSGDRYRHIDKVRFSDVIAHAAEFDVGIAPLADTPMNRSRSNVKVKEYAAAGTPWLASPIGPYVGLGEKQGGRLVADDKWLAALDRLVTRARDRRKLAKHATRWARTQTVDGNVVAWEAAFERAIARAAAAA